MSTVLGSDRVQVNNRWVHCDGSNIGFLNTGGGWSWYQNSSQQVWTAAYGWLHDYFFSTISNCAAGYGMSNVVVSNCGNIAGERIELVDQGSNMRIQTSRWNYNCNCTCK